MTSEDPLRKSLFTRIKDCVLTELRRSNNDVKRSSCPSRSTWAWEIDNNGIRGKKPNADQQGQDTSKGTRVAESNDHKAKKIEQPDKDVSCEEKPEGAHMEKRSEKGNINVDHENDKKRHERHIEIEGNNNENKHERDIEKKNNIREKNRSSEIEEKDAKRSCKGCKPVRYYIKMQNPEAPVCCEGLKSRKLCPPKIRKGQREIPDAWSRPTCRCGACTSNAR